VGTSLGQQIGLGVVEEGGEPGQLGTDLVRDAAPLAASASSCAKAAAMNAEMTRPAGPRHPTPSGVGERSRAQQIGIRGLLRERAEVVISSVIGGSSNLVGFSDPTLPTTALSHLS